MTFNINKTVYRDSDLCQVRPPFLICTETKTILISVWWTESILFINIAPASPSRTEHLIQRPTCCWERNPLPRSPTASYSHLDKPALFTDVKITKKFPTSAFWLKIDEPTLTRQLDFFNIARREEGKRGKDNKILPVPLIIRL